MDASGPPQVSTPVRGPVDTSRRPTMILVSALGVLACISLFVGVGTLDPRSLLVDPQAWALMAASRLPRTLAALLAGGGLAIAGLVMQAMARNRFVEPSTAGTVQGAALGILVVTILAPSAPILVKVTGAAICALAATSLFLALAHRLPPTQPFLIPLFGIVYGGVVGSAVTYVAWQYDLLQLIEVWLNGEFSGVLRGRYELLWLTAAFVLLVWWVADRLTIMSLGREASTGLGIDYPRMLQLGLVIVSVISALTVVVVGAIPFVGLVVPALVARLSGDNLRATVPLVGLAGAMLVLACDIAGRLIRFPYEIPVGTVLGVVGAVSFLAILHWRSRDG